MEQIHPTKSHLIAVTTELIYQKPISQITADEVLEKSHVSKGSIYHHFVDFPDLIDECQLEIFREFTQNIITRLNEIFRDTDSVEIARERFHQVAAYRESDIASRVRILRMEIAVKASQNPNFGKKLAAIEDSLNDAWIALYTEAINRGWGEPSLDPRAVGILMQSTIAGRIVDDVCVRHMEKEAWVTVIQYLLDQYIFGRAKV